MYSIYYNVYIVEIFAIKFNVYIPSIDSISIVCV